MFAVRPISFLASLAVVVLIAMSAMAQQPPAATTTAAATATPPIIVIVDVQQILRDSLVAKDVQGQMSQRTDRYTKEVAAQENDLQHTQEDLEKQRTVLSPEAFNTKMRDFQQRYDALDQGVQATRQSLQQAYNDAMSKIENTALQIIADVAAERKANLVISKAAVLFEEPGFDITQDVIHRLDAKLPAVSLNLPTPPLPSGAPTAAVVGPRTTSADGAAASGAGTEIIMADPRFFTVAGPFRVAEIAERIGAEVVGDGDRVIRDVASLESATENDLSFLDNRRYIPAFEAAKAGAIVVNRKLAPTAPAGATLLFTEMPYRAYALAAQMFYPEKPPVPGIAPSAVIDPSAIVGDGCAIGAHAVIGPRVVIGKRCEIVANAVIGAAVILGDDVRVGANASVSHAVVGSRVRIYPGARIGQDGFGFAPDPHAPIKVPQLGRVIIGDDVEIGANATIDRGAGPDTVIGSGTMIDNLVQIAHNVQIGKGCILVAQVGVSGSTRFEDYVVVGGQAGFTGHLTIGRGAQIAAQSGIMRDVEPGAVLFGSPAWPAREHHQVMTFIRRLAAKRKVADRD